MLRPTRWRAVIIPMRAGFWDKPILYGLILSSFALTDGRTANDTVHLIREGCFMWSFYDKYPNLKFYYFNSAIF